MLGHHDSQTRYNTPDGSEPIHGIDPAPAKMNDTERIDLLAELFKEAPTATILYTDDPDVARVGFTISVENVCDPIRVTAPTFRKALDKLKRELARQDALEPSI